MKLNKYKYELKHSKLELQFYIDNMLYVIFSNDSNENLHYIYISDL